MLASYKESAVALTLYRLKRSVTSCRGCFLSQRWDHIKLCTWQHSFAYAGQGLVFAGFFSTYVVWHACIYSMIVDVRTWTWWMCVLRTSTGLLDRRRHIRRERCDDGGCKNRSVDSVCFVSQIMCVCVCWVSRGRCPGSHAISMLVRTCACLAVCSCVWSDVQPINTISFPSVICKADNESPLTFNFECQTWTSEINFWSISLNISLLTFHFTFNFSLHNQYTHSGVHTEILFKYSLLKSMGQYFM